MAAQGRTFSTFWFLHHIPSFARAFLVQKKSYCRQPLPRRFPLQSCHKVSWEEPTGCRLSSECDLSSEWGAGERCWSVSSGETAALETGDTAAETAALETADAAAETAALETGEAVKRTAALENAEAVKRTVALETGEESMALAASSEAR